MASKDLKTTKNSKSVDAFLGSVSDEQRQSDARKLCKVMQEVTGEEPVMWGASIVGFGSYHYKYASGREGDWLKIGFSPRKASLTLYFMDGFDEHSELLGKLGPHTIAKSCLYIKALDNVDSGILRQLIANSYKNVSMGQV